MEVAPVIDEITGMRQTRQMERRRLSMDTAVVQDKNNPIGEKTARQNTRRSKSRQSPQEDVHVPESNSNETADIRQTRQIKRRRLSMDTAVVPDKTNSVGEKTPRQNTRRSSSRASLQEEVPVQDEVPIQDSTSIGEKAPRQITRRSTSRASLQEEVPLQDTTSGEKTPRPDTRRSRSQPSLQEEVHVTSIREKTPRRITRRSTSRASLQEEAPVQDSTSIKEKTPRQNTRRSTSRPLLQEEVHVQDSIPSGKNTPIQMERRSRSRSLVQEGDNTQDINPEESLEKSDSMPIIEACISQRSYSSSACILPQIPEDEENEITINGGESSPDSPPYASEYVRALKRSMKCRRSIHSEPAKLADIPYMPYATASCLNQQPTFKRRRSPSPIDGASFLNQQQVFKRRRGSSPVEKSKPYFGRLLGLFRSGNNADIDKDDKDVPSKIGCAIM